MRTNEESRVYFEIYLVAGIVVASYDSKVMSYRAVFSYFYRPVFITSDESWPIDISAIFDGRKITYVKVRMNLYVHAFQLI